MDLSQLSDAELLTILQKGQQQAVAELYDRHSGAMMQLAYRIMQNQRDAEDLIHDVFVEAWQKSDTYHPDRGSVRNWLLIRVRSRGIDRLRALKTARNYGLMEADTQPMGTEDASASLHEKALINRTLELLPENQRQIVLLSYFQGLSCSEISQQYDIPLGTVKSRLRGGVQRLRQLLVPQPSEAEANG